MKNICLNGMTSGVTPTELDSFCSEGAILVWLLFVF